MKIARNAAEAFESLRTHELESIPFEAPELATLCSALKRATLDHFEAIDHDLRNRLLDAHIHKRKARPGGPRLRLRSNVHFARFLHREAAGVPGNDAALQRSVARSVMIHAGLYDGLVDRAAVLSEIERLRPGAFLWLPLRSRRHCYDLWIEREPNDGLRLVAAEKLHDGPQAPITRIPSGPLSGQAKDVVLELLEIALQPSTPWSVRPPRILGAIATTTSEPVAWRTRQAGPTCWVTGRTAAFSEVLPKSSRRTLKQAYIRTLGRELAGARERDIDEYCRARGARRVHRALADAGERALLLERDASGRTTLVSALLAPISSRERRRFVRAAELLLASRPLFAAALADDARKIRELVAPLDPDARAALLEESATTGWPALGFALAAGHVRAAEALLQAGARLDPGGHVDLSYVEAAMVSGAARRLFALFSMHLGPVTRRELASAHLITAIVRRDRSEVRALLEAEGLELLHEPGPDGRRTPLGVALSGPDDPEAVLGRRAFAEVRAEQLLGQAVFHRLITEAGADRLTRTLDLLPDAVAGALLREPNALGLTPLGWACYRGRAEHARALWTREPELFDGAQGPMRVTPRMLMAANPGLIDRLVDTLRAGPADLDVPDAMGSTALHYAARKRNAEAVLALLAFGARCDLEDGTGQTPRAIAEEHRDQASLRWLASPETAVRHYEEAVARRRSASMARRRTWTLLGMAGVIGLSLFVAPRVALGSLTSLRVGARGGASGTSAGDPRRRVREDGRRR